MSEDCNHSHEREMGVLTTERDNALLEAERLTAELGYWKSGRRRKGLSVVESVPDGITYAARLLRAQGTEGGEEHDNLLAESAGRLKALSDAASHLLAEAVINRAEVGKLRAALNSCGCDGQAYEDIRAERDAARDAVAAMTVEIADLRAIVERVRLLHVDSVAGVCPSCGRIGDVSDEDDGLVSYPCPTILALNPVVTADVGERSAVTTAGDDADRLIDSILREPS